MRIFQYVRKFRRTQDPLIEIKISSKAILDNYRLFENEYEVPIAPVLKSNAYGHGLLEVADILSPITAPMLVVDSIHEVQLLRGNGIYRPILVIGYTRPEAIARNKQRNVAFTLTSLAQIKAVVESGARVSVHIKIDTGMRRQGIVPQEIDDAIRLLKESNVSVEGICSHFADADGETDVFTRSQIALWNALVPQWQSAFPSLGYWHLAATAGSAFAKEVDANMVRLGTGMYGFPRHPSQTFGLRPALSMHSLITGVKDLAPGEHVGYNCTFTAEKPVRIATVPVGYFEGVDRRLSNKGAMTVEGVACPIIGRVSMNISTIDVTNCPTVKLETPVTVFSNKSEDPNSLVKFADMCNTTPLELLVHIPQHLRRVVVNT